MGEQTSDKGTEPGAMDDDAIERAKKKNAKTKQTIDELFNDNTTGRYGPATDS